jgi:hypothetical protein
MKITNQLHNGCLILVALGLGITQHLNASLQFNGSNSKAVLDGSYLDGSTHSNYTFEVWIKPYSLGGTTIGKTEYWKEWTLDTESDGGLSFRGAWPNYYWGTETATNSVTTNKWQHICCAVANGQASFYVNGGFVDTEAVQNPIDFYASTNTGGSPQYPWDGVMMIGYTESGTTPDYNFFNGLIYGIRVWSRTLSASEVEIIATTGVPPSTNGLYNAVMLNEGSGSTIHDSLTSLTGRVLTAQWSSDQPTFSGQVGATIRVPQDQPTIAAGIAAAQDGDTVLVSGGVYREHNLTITNGIAVLSVGGSGVTTIDGQSIGGTRVFTVNSTSTNLATISGFSIINGNAYSTRLDGAGLHWIAGPLLISNCVFSNNYADGGVIGTTTTPYDPTKLTVVSCIFNNNNAENLAGIVGATVIRCLLYNNTGWNNPVVLENCISTNCTVYNNTGGVLSNPWTTGGMGGGTADNCIFWGNSGYNGQQVDQTSSAVVTYSIVQGGNAGTGNLSSDPLFVDASAGDFQLQTNSPAKNSGDPTTFNLDGSRADMGAYGGGGSPLPINLSSGLVAYLPFDGNANDASGNGHNGTVTGATLTTNRFGQANGAYLFGGAAAYITAPLDASVFSNDFTASVWFMATDIADGWPTLLNEQGVSAGYTPFNLQIAGSTCGCDSPGYLIADATYSGPSFNWFLDRRQQTPTGTYCQAVVTKAGTNVVLYLNSQVTVTGSVSSPITQTGDTLWIGRAPTEDVPGDSVFHGIIDDVRIYNLALSSNEVAALYALESTPPSPPPPACIPYAATANAIVTNGFVIGVATTDGGCGYTNTPSVRIIGGGGSGAEAVSVASNGVVTAVNVQVTGSGYTNTPAVVIAPPFIPQPTISITALIFGPLVTPVLQLSLANLSPYDNYQLESTPAAGGAWTNLGTPFTPTASANTQYVDAIGNVGFFRVKYVP